MGYQHRLLTLLAVCSLSLTAHAGDSCQTRTADWKPTLPADDQRVLQSFIEPARRDNAPLLLDYVQQTRSPNAPILSNYARLRLAALALRDGDTQFARQQLSQIEQNSPAAVDAALLLADSYRRDGDMERARGWFLRIAARFPGNPRAVSGLVLAGDDWRKQGAPELALPVYNLALSKAEENMQALEQLQQDPDQLFRTLTNTVAGNSTTVTDQLVLALVRDPHSQVLDATRQLMVAHSEKKCLREQGKALHNALQHASARDLSNAAFRTAANREKAATEQEVADLKRILQNAPDAQDLQARLADAEGRLERLNHRLNTLGSTEVPPELQKREAALDAQEKRVDQQIRQARQQVRTALQKQLPTLKTFYRNLAGEAQLGKAQLLQSSS
ncbi:hypothetical protein A11A3_05234 [Alcanivorax hongdengensis A-11-3]|uniref:Tetratricopeptide repeat protein n=1 Tax=Alcanivorax hongdengensis A-11-3 TaxID=1177179 RepID=L0WEB6_9GAMM|nr:tetratricopeptide repeat protein [Alcanivorax hongdengensis]EKF75069.1 hypothetical protein A11A3_05234 [Alcanivorax hongdengensis A-11-3]